MLEFVFRTFASGDTAVPATGIEAIPSQLAERLPDGVLHLNTRVTAIDGDKVRIESGDILQGAAVVIATEASGSS